MQEKWKKSYNNFPFSANKNRFISVLEGETTEGEDVVSDEEGGATV